MANHHLLDATEKIGMANIYLPKQRSSKVAVPAFQALLTERTQPQTLEPSASNASADLANRRFLAILIEFTVVSLVSSLEAQTDKRKGAFSFIKEIHRTGYHLHKRKELRKRPEIH